MMEFIKQSIPLDLSQPSFWISIFSILFNPLAWNIVARQEYHTRWLSKRVGGPYPACYTLAGSIFIAGLIRDALFARAIQKQPISSWMLNWSWLGSILFAWGSILVWSSMYQLGVTGTYLGDYCGILMKRRVTSFPFNILENPMYIGSTLCFIGTAIWNSSGAGLILSSIVWIVYWIALKFEGPFTEKIYAAENESSQSKSVKSRTSISSKKIA